MRDQNYLFSQVDWHSKDQDQRKSLEGEIDSIDGNRLLNTSLEDLYDYFEKKYALTVPTLIMEDIVADQRETKIEVTNDRMRSFFGEPGQSLYVNGTLVEILVPFEGDVNIFDVRPSSFSLSPPQAEIRNNCIVLKVKGENLSPEQVKREIDRIISQIKEHLNTLQSNCSGFNNQLRDIAKLSIEKRKNRLLRDKNLVSSLGFNIKERVGESRTYNAPEVHRKITPSLPPASTSPYKPEPTLTNSDYDHILSIIQNMVQVMERSPSAFKSMDEESIRSHFLVQLNGHYEGQATGETFNCNGKTDILVRSGGKNIFIAECKFWSGPKNLLETIDQLLSYSSWRDTKVAVIVFNRNKNFSKVLESIRQTSKEHGNYKREILLSSETTFRYIFAHRDDHNRELLMSIMAFDVPVE
jgi:hypothetical protein